MQPQESGSGAQDTSFQALQTGTDTARLEPQIADESARTTRIEVPSRETNCKHPAPAKIEIPTRVFSSSPSLGTKEGASSDRRSPKYAALQVFFDKVATYTHDTVNFSAIKWDPNDKTSVIKQVGTNDDAANGVARDAAYDNGGALNPVWGFVYNSTPFGLEFELMMRFLYDEGGLALAQSIVDRRGMNVKLLPVVGSNPQGSGYFQHPIGSVDCEGERDCLKERPIGLEGLCQAGWTFRYLPPAQNVLDNACSQLVLDGRIPSKDIKFVASVPGATNLGAVQAGKITAFEFATPLDDYDPTGSGFFPLLPNSQVVPLASQNPGHKGLRFAHFPSWHQPFYVGWIMVNKSSVWDKIPQHHQRAIEHAAKDALEESYWYSNTLQCEALENILDHNNGQKQLAADGSPILVDGHTVSADIKLAEWPREALVRLEIETNKYLESLKGGDTPTIDQQDYRSVIDALHAYMKKIHYRWEAHHFDDSLQCRFKRSR